MSISRADVEKVSLLARLKLSPTELDALTVQLANVVEYVEQLNELNTDAIAPMAHAVELTNVFRADEAQPSLPRAAALSNAPHHDDECYLVPAVLGE